MTIGTFSLSGKPMLAVALLVPLTLSGLLLIPSMVYVAHAEPGINPLLRPTCGFDITLVAETSGGIDSFELDELKSGLKAFVAGLVPASGSQFSLIDLDTQASVLQPFTGNITTINTAIDSLSNEQDNQHTNWVDAIVKAHSTFPNRVNPDLVVIATDSNPYYVGNPGTAATDLEALNAAVTAANTLKSAGIRIVAVGIGSDVTLANLNLISGTNVNTGANSDVITSAFQTTASDPLKLESDLSAFAAALLPLAAAPCEVIFPIGSEIVTTAQTEVRGNPGLANAIWGGQAAGAKGKIVSGPVFLDGMNWWKIDFQWAPDGWVTDKTIATAPAASFPIGSTIVTTALTDVRGNPGLANAIWGRQVAGRTGKIVGGPVSADNLTWWKIDFQWAPDGWVTDKTIKKP